MEEPVFVSVLRCLHRVWSLLPYHDPVCLLNPAWELWEQEGGGGGGQGATASDGANATRVILPRVCSPLRRWRATAWRMPCQAALCKIPESCLLPKFQPEGIKPLFPAIYPVPRRRPEAAGSPSPHAALVSLLLHLGFLPHTGQAPELLEGNLHQPSNEAKQNSCNKYDKDVVPFPNTDF